MNLPIVSAAMAMLLVAIPASAQQSHGSIQGRVVDAAGGLPLGDAIITVPGTELRAVTDSAGEFRVDGIDPGEVLIRLERSGFVTVTEPVLVHGGWTTSAAFELAPVAALLDALRVFADAEQVRARPASIGELRMGDQTTGATTDRLGALMPGVQVMRPSGEVGRGTRIRIRGPSSISLSNQPVVYLDGIRVEAELSGFRNEGLISLDFVSPEAIDRIEVLKGPSASALYGPDSSNGVILIHTKR
ncbi:MAG: TonB-dependent receptor plug domain-containing protein [Longimicrobiales bacterium]